MSRALRATVLLAAVLLAAPVAGRERAGAAGRNPGTDCIATALTPIGTGPGAPGPFEAETREVDFAASRTPVTVFLPKETTPVRRPVIFFSHGYGPNVWSVYEPLLRHIASRGNVVVFGVFPLGLASMKTRYETLWAGFETAAQKLSDRVDLGRVGFMGHSFGGGANPTMAYAGIVERGWGRQGAFLFELAPWYTYGMDEEKFNRFPSHLLHVAQVYDHDKTNDHAMAYDLYRQFRRAAGNWLLQVRSSEENGCRIEAAHMLPARAKNANLVQYAVMRPLDVVMQAAFERGDPGQLARVLAPATSGYQPVEILASVPTASPANNYRFGWEGRMNPRKAGADVRQQFSEMSGAKELSIDEGQDEGKHGGLLERLRERRAGKSE